MDIRDFLTVVVRTTLIDLDQFSLFQGRNLYGTGGISYVTYLAEKQKVLSDVVAGSLFRCTIQLLENREVVTECSCGEPTCQHIVATCFALLDKYAMAASSMPLAASTTNDKLSHKVGTARNVKIQPMRRVSADKFRIVKGLGRTADPAKMIDKLSPRMRGINLLDVELLLRPDNIVEAKARFHDRYAGSGWDGTYTDISVEMRIVNTFDLEIKCNACTYKGTKLCEHQAVIMSFLEDYDWLGDLFTKDYNYDAFLTESAKIFTIREDQIESFYDMHIQDDGAVRVLPKPDGIIVPSHLDFAKAVTKLRESKDQKLTRLSKQQQMGYGLLWFLEGVEPLKGKYNKARTKLISRLEEIALDEVDDRPFRQLVTDIITACKDNDEYAQHLATKRALPTLAEANHFFLHHKSSYGQNKSDYKAIQLHPTTIKLRCVIQRDGNIATASFELFDDHLSIKVSGIQYMFGGLLLTAERTAYVMESYESYAIMTTYGTRGSVPFLTDDPLVEGLYNYLSLADEVVTDNMTVKVLEDCTKQLWLKSAGQVIAIEPILLYDEERINVLGRNKVVDIVQETTIVPNEQDVSTFSAVLQDILPQGIDRTTGDDYIFITLEDFYRDRWFLDFFEKCRQAGVEVYGHEEIKGFNQSTYRANIQMTVSSGIDWFDTHVDMTFGNIVVPAKEWVASIQSGNNYVKLSDGTQGTVPQHWIERLRKLTDVADVSKEGTLQISKLLFNVVDDLFDEIDDEELMAELRSKQQALETYDNSKKYALPEGLQAELRPYQIQGYQWMKFLEEYGFGGCLADDMGLGKTLQVITILLDQHQQGKGRSLIVVPRSLLFNWSAEIDKFAPQLKYLIHHGQSRDRSLESYSDELDMIISTFDTVCKDIEVFSEVTYNYVVLDESQTIKNLKSKRYKGMRLLKARQRIAMTGTPIENNTFDLYAQLSFLNPGLLGSAKAFKDRFATPIDGRGDTGKLALLKKLIHPFMLRRTKAQVAADLPEKTETVILCEMDRVQRKLYNELKQSIRQDIEGMIEEGGVNRAKFKILDGLLRLRQICNAPELVNSRLPKRQKASVKIDTLIEHIQDLGDHKALVFSQFVGMLTIIKDRFDALGISYAYLDGSTHDRQSAVSEFMDKDDCKVFLISIKAGNTGLNLTKADYVYIVDPWWNPAVEAQAIDRTHRIGQEQHVFAYKMIVKDTIEEKIVELQSKKRKLAQDLIQVDESVFKSLNKEELIALFD